jgi:mannose-6-phosphate isomerase-like protein (cupin superfamily)
MEAQPSFLVAPGSGEIVGDAPDRRVEILSDDDALHATWSRFGPHREGADPHVHRDHTDLFYVLDGELTVLLGPEARPVAVPAGTLVRVPPLVVHGFRNGSDADVRYLNLHAPGQGFADFMRGLRDGSAVAYDQHPPPTDGGRPPTEAVLGSEGVVVERPGLRVVALSDVDAIAIAEISCDPGVQPGPSQTDHDAVRSYCVLAGELAFSVGDQEFRAETDSWVQMPAGMPHTLAVSGSQPARFLDLLTPGVRAG